ncbi:tRNA glutamyl-Q(34) synthetase GluQRS, partial [Cronobacter sakazakii]|nr:tRNA glutamyl-Q(34) synthetase GluQRS [Cronobacter sakazakii]
APPLPEGDPRPVLVEALAFLNQPVDADWRAFSTETLLRQAVEKWDLSAVPAAAAANPAFSNALR